MDPSSSWKRVRESRWVQAVFVYLAGAWVTLQVVTIFTQAFDWPRWVMRATIAALAIGLVVTIAVVWARSRRETRDEEADDDPAGRPVLAGAAAIGLLLAGFALWAIVRDDGTGLAPSPALAHAAPGVAILPFHVNDPDLDRWREGMIDLLSTNLDGALGLRTIDSRTVLARWREAVGAEPDADLATTLDVARSAGGRYGLVGHVVSSGVSMRVTAEVYDLESGSSLGERQVEGVPDSIFGLVDRLSVEVLEILLEREGGNLPDMELARITTPSLTALKSYLDGETRLRRSDFEAAISAFGDAVDADSTFALAHYRLASAHGWLGGVGDPDAVRRLAAARRHADRLPERDRSLLEVSEAYYRADPNATEIAADAAEAYPDDPEASYLLGEVRFHVRYQSLATREMVEAPFAQSLDLDPGFGPGYHHLLDLAFQYADSVAADTLLARYLENAAPGSYDERYESLFALAFGPDSARLARLDSIPAAALNLVAADLGHPRFLDLQARVIDRIEEQTGQAVAFLGVINRFRRGRLDDFYGVISAADVPPPQRDQWLSLAVSYDAPGADAWLDRFGSAPSGPIPEVSAAFYALARGDLTAARKRIAELDSLRGRAEAAGDSTQARALAVFGDALEGRALMLEERDVEATEKLDRAFRVTGAPPLAIWLAEAYVRLGRVDDAIRVFQVIGPDPWLSHRLAPLYEQTGNTEAAIEAWSWRVAAWEDADPVLRDDWLHARSEVARLRGLQRT